MCGCSVCSAMAGSWHARPDFLYPYVIVPARYQGTYEGGAVLSFPVELEAVSNTDYVGGDVECAIFWGNHAHLPIGKGDTPQAAFDDMVNKLKNPEDEFTAWVNHVRATNNAIR